MPEITRPRRGQLMRKLFEILLENPDGLSPAAAITKLAERADLTDYETEAVASGRPRYVKMMHFASTTLTKAGWLAKYDRKKWLVTAEGKQAYQTYTDPYQFFINAENKRMAAQLASGFTNPNPATLTVPDDEIDETSEAAITFDQADQQAWMEIEQFLRGMPPYEFQDLVASLLRAMNYHVSWIAPPGKDGGIDILAWGDPLGTRPPRIKVQVRRYSSNITVDGLRSFMALLGDDDVGLFVTTCGFTRDARDEARTQANRKVTLVDLEKFFDLWVEYYPKLDDAARRKFPLQPIYFLAPGN